MVSSGGHSPATLTRAFRLLALIFLAFLWMPTPASAQTKVYLASWGPSDFNIYSKPDWYATYIEVVPATKPNKDPVIKVIAHFAEAKSRTLLGGDSDREIGSYEISCTARTSRVLSVRKEKQRKLVEDKSMTLPAEPIRPGTVLGLATQIACDGAAQNYAKSQINDMSQDSLSRFDILKAIDAGHKGGKWSQLGIFGKPPNRLALFVEGESFVSAPNGKKLLTALFVHATANPSSGEAAIYYRVELDCLSNDAKMNFVVSFKADGSAFGPQFQNNVSASPAVKGALSDLMCNKNLAVYPTITGSGNVIATTFFKTPR